MTQPVDLAALRAVQKWLVCSHKNTCGGNDYIECTDCGFMWDYRRAPNCGPMSNEASYEFIRDAHIKAAIAAMWPALLTELEQLRAQVAGLNGQIVIGEENERHLRAQLKTVTLDRDSWQQAATNRAEDQTILERKLEAVTAELRGQTA